jgi:hypothetical protein
MLEERFRRNYKFRRITLQFQKEFSLSEIQMFLKRCRKRMVFCMSTKSMRGFMVCDCFRTSLATEQSACPYNISMR